MDKRNVLVVLGLIIVVIVGGVFLYDAVLGETKEASGPISAVPLEVAGTAEAAAGESGGDEITAGAGNSGLTVYTISQDSSQASFTLSEVLRGSPTTVVGTTDQVAGEIAIDLDDLSAAQVGTIQVNARTLVTDEDRRNQAIRNRILNTDSFEFVTFTPTEIVGLNGSAAPGQALTFQIVGDLTIRDITQQVTFDVTAQVDEAGTLVGTAVATINRSQFDLSIPSVPFVADVSEEVTLALDFIALAA